MQTVRWLVATATALGLASGALAQQMAPPARPGVACKSDFQTLCANIPAGGGGRMKCLMDNADKLSPGCKAALDAVSAARAAMRQACAGDAQTLCAGAAPADRMKCLAANEDKLSDGCKSAMAALPGQRGQGGLQK